MKNIKGFTAFDLGVKFCNIPIIKLLYAEDRNKSSEIS